MKGQIARKASLLQELDNQLTASNLVRKRILEGPNSMFRALSDTLLHTENQAHSLQQISLEYFNRCVKEETLPSKLSHFFETPTLAKEFADNPDLGCFGKTHLELLSQCFSTSIEVYSLTDDLHLNCLVINNQHRKTIHLSKTLNHYDPIYTRDHMDMYNEIQDFIYQKLNLKPEPNCNDQTDYILERRPSQLHKRKHKKSLSACDELEYKQLEDIFNGNVLGEGDEIGHLLKGKTDQYSVSKECPATERKRSLDKLDSSHHNNYQQFPYDDRSSFSLGTFPEHRSVQSERLINLASEEALNSGANNRRYQGRLKFFDENKNYGFLIMDEDGSEIFVHFDDLLKAGMNKEFLRNTKHGYVLRFQFGCMFYVGKYKNSRKAVDLLMLGGFLQPMY